MRLKAWREKDKFGVMIGTLFLKQKRFYNKGVGSFKKGLEEETT